MIIGINALKILSGYIIPRLAIPIDDLAVPYAAPKIAKTSALATPTYAKKKG